MTGMPSLCEAEFPFKISTALSAVDATRDGVICTVKIVHLLPAPSTYMSKEAANPEQNNVKMKEVLSITTLGSASAGKL